MAASRAISQPVAPLQTQPKSGVTVHGLLGSVAWARSRSAPAKGLIVLLRQLGAGAGAAFPRATMTPLSAATVVPSRPLRSLRNATGSQMLRTASESTAMPVATTKSEWLRDGLIRALRRLRHCAAIDPSSNLEKRDIYEPAYDPFGSQKGAEASRADRRLSRITQCVRLRIFNPQSQINFRKGRLFTDGLKTATTTVIYRYIIDASRVAAVSRAHVRRHLLVQDYRSKRRPTTLPPFAQHQRTPSGHSSCKICPGQG